MRKTPGSTTIDWIPNGAISTESASLMPATANFDALYRLTPGSPSKPDREPMCTSLPDPCLRMTGSTARVTLIRPKTLRSNSDRASASVISSNAPSKPRPALLTRTSMPPNRSTAASTACGMLSLSVTSRATAKTLSELLRSAGTRSGFRTATATLLPPASAARAISAPIPREAPVTNHVAMGNTSFVASPSRGFPVDVFECARRPRRYEGCAFPGSPTPRKTWRPFLGSNSGCRRRHPAQAPCAGFCW